MVNRMEESTPQPIIECQDLYKAYDKGHVLNGINLKAYPGQIIGLVGPSGSGKSTLLQSMVGLHRYIGSCKVNNFESFGNRVNILNTACFVPDVAVLPSWMKVWQCFKMMETVYPKFDEQRAREVLKRLQIQDKDNIESLSKGMKAQLHLAMALSVPSEILILDEPTIGLDPLAREWFYNWLVNDYFNPDRIIIISSHVIDEIDNIITDTIFLQHGYIDIYKPIVELRGDYICIEVPKSLENLRLARQSRYIHESPGINYHDFLFDVGEYRLMQESLDQLGKPKAASLSQIFKAHFAKG